MKEELKISLSNLMPLSNNEKLEILKYIEKQDKEIERLNNIINESAEEILKEYLEKLKRKSDNKPIVVSNSAMVDIKGKNFYCTCGANVFTQYDDDTFVCHGCGNKYQGE